MTKDNANFQQGQSPSEQEGTPMWGAPLDVHHSRREYVRSLGGAQSVLPDSDELGYNTRRQPHMGDELVRMAGALQQAQYDHTIQVLRGMAGKADYPDGGSTGPAQGKVKAVQQYGLGPGYARRAAEGHDPISTTPPTDYFRRPEGLEKYMGAKGLVPEGGYGSGYGSWDRGSQFHTMGDDIGALFDQEQQ